jgi:hypothetical protein
MVLGLELMAAQYLLYSLALLLGGVVSLVGLLFYCELDLLATMVLTTYAAVFLLLALLVTQFGPSTGRAEGLSKGGRGHGGVLVFAFMLLMGAGPISPFASS